MAIAASPPEFVRTKFRSARDTTKTKKDTKPVRVAVDCARRFASHCSGNRSQSMAQQPIMFMQETSSTSSANAATSLNTMTIHPSSRAG